MKRNINKEDFKTTMKMAWPAMIESFFTAFVGLVDSFMVSSLGSNAVAAVGLTTQPKFIGLAMFFAANVSISATAFSCKFAIAGYGKRKTESQHGKD